jgi:hypothetical protein
VNLAKNFVLRQEVVSPVRRRMLLCLALKPPRLDLSLRMKEHFSVCSGWFFDWNRLGSLVDADKRFTVKRYREP